jgi:hypothetical protein
VRGLDALMAQPESNDSDVYASLEQMHRRRVAAMSPKK